MGVDGTAYAVLWGEGKQSLCATEGKYSSSTQSDDVNSSRDPAHTEDHDCQVEGSDVTMWVRRAVKTEESMTETSG